RLAQRDLGHGLGVVGLAPVAHRRVHGAADSRLDAGAVRLSAAHRQGEAPDPRGERGAALRRQDKEGALRGPARSPGSAPARARRRSRREESALVRPADPARIPRHAPRRVAATRVAAALALVMMAPGAARAAAPGGACVGRYVLVRASGKLLDRTRDTLVLDTTSAVIDPACGAATVAARPARGGSRIAARWAARRGARAPRPR